MVQGEDELAYCQRNEQPGRNVKAARFYQPERQAETGIPPYKGQNQQVCVQGAAITHRESERGDQINNGKNSEEFAQQWSLITKQVDGQLTEGQANHQQ